MRHETSFLITLMCVVMACGASQAAPTLQVGSPTLAPGGTGVLPLSVSGGAEPFAGINARLVLPPKIHCTEVLLGPALSGGFIKDSLVAGDPETVTVVAYSGSLTFTNGEVLHLQLRADADAAVGAQDVVFASAKAEVTVNAKWALSNATGETSIKDILPQNGKITVTVNIEGEPPAEGELPDSDTDGLPDDWELEHFGTLDQGPNDDFDGDGLSNGQERDRGFNPALFVGDVDGNKTITGADATRVLQIIVGLRETGTLLDWADTNHDGTITPADATRVLQIVTEMRSIESIQR